MILTIFHGFCMALADSVPGISGGTVAFIMGFYEQFIAAIHNLFGKDAAARKAGGTYLLRMGIGWCIGLGSSVLVLSRVFEKNIHFLSSLFLGLTISSIPFVLYSERKVLRNHANDLVFTILGIAVVCGLTMYRATSPSGAAVHFLTLTPLDFLYLAIAGMIAVSAMVLPGISGSTFLLIFGVYMPIVNGIKQILNAQWAYFPGLFVFGVGVLIGVFLSTRYIRACFRAYHAQMLYLILGFMLGSIYAVIMGPLTLEVPQAPLGIQNFEVSGFIAGVLLLFVLELLRHKFPIPMPKTKE